MNKILEFFTSVTLLSLATHASSQIVLTESDLPSVGDVQISIKVDSIQAASLSEGPAGENHLWNFSNLIPCCGLPASEDTVEWLDAHNADPDNNFPGATLAVKGHLYTYHSHVTHKDETVIHHKFYFKDTGGLKFYSTDYPANAISQPSLLVQPLLVYNELIVVNTRLVFELSSDSLQKFSVIDSIFADAWGTLITPTDTFSTIRYRTVEYSVDSLFVNGSLTSTANSNGTSWKWFTNGISLPVLQIGEGILSAQTGSRSAEYSIKSGNFLGIDDPVANQFPVKVFPNPFQTKTTFLLGVNRSSKLFLEICDLAGRQVNRVDGINSTEVIIERGNLPAGLYFYRIFSSGIPVTSGKLIVQ